MRPQWRKGCRCGACGRSPVVTGISGFPPQGLTLSSALWFPGPSVLVSGLSLGISLSCLSVLRMAVCREPQQQEVGQHLRLFLDAEN